jgi:peptidoglycan hydrolase-like protein with peptidoglycan-binding domain
VVRATVLSGCLALLAGVLSAAPANAGNRVTPGNFTGYGFDQCLAPSQAAMDAWLTSSQFWAVGIYISGASRACVSQPNLSPTWVSTQLRKGWRLLPLTVGPQASCSTRDSYRNEKRISPKPDGHYSRAREQGRAEAKKTVRAARALGISARSTLWYDIEAFPMNRPRCTESALSFLSAWTRQLHALNYVSGVYSSAASGIKILDDAKAAKAAHTMPDQVWIADWNGKANVDSSYIRPKSWMPHGRIHQYRGGHLERHGGVTINIDSNFMSLGRGSYARSLKPACGVGIDLPDYHPLAFGDRSSEVRSLKCLLKLKGTYRGKLYSGFNKRTVAAVKSYQRSRGIDPSGVATLRTWTALHAEGRALVLKYGSAGVAVRRVQRALNAAVDAHLPITGVFEGATKKAVREYQKLRRIPATGVVETRTWAQLSNGMIRPAVRKQSEQVGRSLPD